MSKGFTIIELLITLVIFSFLIFITVATLHTVMFGSSQQFLAIDNVDRARLTTSRFVNEIRNAMVGVDGSYQLTTAADNQIIFYTKTTHSLTVNRVNYYLLGTNLWRGVVVPTGTPQTYNLANEVKIIVQTDVVGQTPIFTYYDGNYNGSTAALSQPVNVNSVKFVKMNLGVLHQAQKQSNETFFISVGGSIRNLKTNLGE